MSNFDQRVTQWMSPSQSVCSPPVNCSQSSTNGFSTAPSTDSSHWSVAIRGVSSMLSTGHLTVGDWPGGSRSGSIPSDAARRLPRSPNMRGVIAML